MAAAIGATSPSAWVPAKDQNPLFSAIQPSRRERLFLPDCVEEPSGRRGADEGGGVKGCLRDWQPRSGGGDCLRAGDELGELAEVLSVAARWNSSRAKSSNPFPSTRWWREQDSNLWFRNSRHAAHDRPL